MCGLSVQCIRYRRSKMESMTNEMSSGGQRQRDAPGNGYGYGF